MFNLDSLNDERAEIMQEQGWAKGCIPESPDSVVESLVQRIDRGRFRVELGSSSNGPRLTGPQNETLFTDPYHLSPHANPVEESQPNNIGPNVEELSPFELLTLGPGPSTQLQELLTPPQSTTLWCEENWNVPTGPVTTKDNSRKRLRREFGKLRRNIRQKLFCRGFERTANQVEENSVQVDGMEVETNSGRWVAGPQQPPLSQ